MENKRSYKSISDRMVAMINKQTDGIAEVRPSDETDLFQEDVRLVGKEGKLYYLPSA